MSITLETQRLILKPVLQDELHCLYKILTNPEVRRYLCDDNVLSMAQVQEIVRQSTGNFVEKRFGLWLIEKKVEPEEIGFAGLTSFFDENQLQLVYALLPSATKQGYATEAASRIIQYCFKELRYGSVVASCDRINIASQKVAERLGMIKVEERMIGESDLLFFSIERSPFQQN